MRLDEGVRQVVASHVRRVLLADDHQAIRRGVRALLEGKPGIEVVGEAPNGRLALEQARLLQPDIAVIDYSLPELNGLDLTTALKREVPRIEVLVYTMHDREDLVLDVLRAGARGYVLKSDSEEELLAAVNALSLHRPYFSGAISETLLDRFIEAAPTAQATLTHREREVVQLIAEGNINKEIGRILNISVKTVETHRASAMHKLKLRTTAELVRYAVRNAIVEP
jgi:DNA-binding NarL/FixJ family response regulator